MEYPFSKQCTVDPDQMPHDVASDLGLHCLPMTLSKNGFRDFLLVTPRNCWGPSLEVPWQNTCLSNEDYSMFHRELT